MADLEIPLDTETPAGKETPAPAAPDAAAASPASDPAKPDAAAGTTPPAGEQPVEWTLALPKDSPLATEAVARITEKAKSLKVTDPALAQAMLDVAHGEVSETIKAYEAAHKKGGALYNAMVEQYESEAKAHKELGAGDPQQYREKTLRASLVLNRYAPELDAVLDETGLKAKAEVLLFLNRVYDATREQPLAEGNDTPRPAQDFSLYPGGIPVDAEAAATP